jgi:hypothetical protein
MVGLPEAIYSSLTLQAEAALVFRDLGVTLSSNGTCYAVPMRQPATYQEIQKWVESQFGFTPETCWIADCKELCGLPLGEAPNRRGDERAKPCPPEKRPAIRKAFQHFGMMDDMR